MRTTITLGTDSGDVACEVEIVKTGTDAFWGFVTIDGQCPMAWDEERNDDLFLQLTERIDNIVEEM